MPEKSTSELLDEYYKKNPGKRPLMRRFADNRKAAAKEKAKYNEIYREEFNKQRAKSLKIRAKAEARAKYQPTKKQKMDDFVNAIGSLGGAPQIKRKTTPSKKKRSGKTQYKIIGGKAYPIAKTSRSTTTSRKKKKTRKSNDPWDLGGLDNIGDFDF